MRIMLITIGSGSTGIDLTCANRVIFFDPWWNPQIESQARDRLHRIGQNREVTAIRFIVEDSVEQRVLELQDIKSELAKMCMDPNSNAEEIEHLRQKLLNGVFRFEDDGGLSLPGL